MTERPELLDLTNRAHELETLAGVLGLLEWDQQTMMPSGAGSARGEQLALLSRLHHERLADPTLGALLDRVGDVENNVHKAMITKLSREHHRAARVPAALVEAIATARNDGFGAWMKAREANDWAAFAPAMRRIVDLMRGLADAHGPAAHPYDHLLDEFDPGATTAELRPMFSRLGGALTERLRAAEGARPPARLRLHVPKASLRRLHTQVLAAMGWRATDGRLDEAEHPFTVGLHPSDVRLTTHLYEDDLLGTLSGTMHEAGHGLYEQGLPASLARTGLRAAAGAAMHESQSRFFENVIGRSEAFFEWFAPLLRAEIGAEAPSAQRLYAAANRVEPSLVRVHADEVTYNLHILLRFELEVKLIDGSLTVDELPAAWDAASYGALGLRAHNVKDGVLQDVHWASGLFGYFPSYTVGNLYAASFRRCIEADQPELWAAVASGDLSGPLRWLRAHIHSHGAMASAPALFKAAVGERDPVADLLGHLDSRGLALLR